MATWLRRIVSGQKKRFQDDGFDLDLAYISPRIIAMGLPADTSKEMLYRNPMPEIARFMHTYHPGRAKVYNLCSEHRYSRDKLLTALQHYGFDDHQTPPLLVVQQFCTDAAAWLAAHPENVVVVHCKAGKGRTGIMICCLLLYLHLNAPHLANLVDALSTAPAADEPGGSEECDAAADADRCSVSSAGSGSSGGSSRGWHPWQSVEPVQVAQLAQPAQDVLRLYAERRTHDGNGVTIASQRRYVAYFWRVLSAGPRPCGSLPAPRTLQLRELVISGLPQGFADSCVVAVEARPTGSSAASASRVLVVPGPRALGGGLPGLCLTPCTAEPLVRDDGCRIAATSSATAGDTLTITMPAASMGLSLLTGKQQHKQAPVAAAPPQPGCCSVCGVGSACGCLGGARLSAAVSPAAAGPPAAVNAAVAYGLAGSEWVPAAGSPRTAAAAAAAITEADVGEATDQQGCCVVEGDVRILVLRGGSRMFYTWFNTAYLPAGGCYSLGRAQLDKPSKILSAELRLTVRYVDMKPQTEEEEQEVRPGQQLAQEQQQGDGLPDEGWAAPAAGARLQAAGGGGWVGLGKRVLTTSSHKRYAGDGAGGAKRSCGPQQQAGRGRKGGGDLPLGGGNTSPQGTAAQLPVLSAAVGAGAEAAGSNASQRAKWNAPLVLTGSSSSSALAGMGQNQQPQAQQQRQQQGGSVSAPASPQCGSGGKLSRSSSWRWQHLPAISSLSSSLWDWTGVAGSVAEDEEQAAAPAAPGAAAARPAVQSRLSWDWDWPSLAAVAASEPVFGGTAAGAPAAASAISSAASAPAGMDVWTHKTAYNPAGARSAGVAVPSALAQWQQQEQKKKPGRASSSGGSAGTRIMQDLHTSGLSRSPAAIELPLLKRPSGASSMLDALLDPAVSLVTSTQLCSQQEQQQQQLAAGKFGARQAAGSGRKSGTSLWQLLLRDTASDAAAGSGNSMVRPSRGTAAAAGSAGASRSRSCEARPGHSSGIAAAAGCGVDNGGDEDDNNEGGDTYPLADVLVRSGEGSRRLAHSEAAAAAQGAAAGDPAGSSDPLQGLLDALNWGTDTWRPSGSSSGGSGWQQRQRRHTYSGPKSNLVAGCSSSGTSSPVVPQQSLKKVHSAPTTPPGLRSLQQELTRQEEEQPRQDAHAQQLISRLLDLEPEDEPPGSLLAAGQSSSSSAGLAAAGQAQPACCVDCVLGLHTVPCPAAPCAAVPAASAPATASPAAAVALMSAVSGRSLQSARSLPLQPAGSSCDADVRVAAIACGLGAGAAGAGAKGAGSAGSGGNGKHPVSRGSWLVGGGRGPGGPHPAAAVSRGVARPGPAGAGAGATAASRRGEASEQLQCLLAAAAGNADDGENDVHVDGDFAAASLGLLSSGEPAAAASLTQQWKQLEKAWQRSWWV